MPRSLRALVILAFCLLGILAPPAWAEDCQCELAATDLMRGGDAAQTIRADLTGVDDLYLIVTFGGDSYSSDQAIWAAPTLIDADGRRVDLTTIAPVEQQMGWGKLFKNENHRGRALNIGGQEFATGFWAHGPSLLHFKLGGKYQGLEASVGIDGGTKLGSVEFQILTEKPEMPTPAMYKGTSSPKVALPKPQPADQSPHHLNRAAADRLLAQGVERLIFIRRYTLNANHVYTEYVNSRWTPGGGLAILDLRTGQVEDLLPELNDGVVNRFDLSYDAKRIVFDYKKADAEGYRIYEVNIDGSGLRQLTFPQEDEARLVELYGRPGYHHGTDDLHPCYLPDGGIVFASTRCQYGVLCDASDNFTVKNLYRMDGDGGNLRPISNSPLSEATPAMLPDGRILYHRWEYVDKAAGNVKSLWAMNPDGSATAEIYGDTISFPETMIYARPIPGADQKICMLGASHCCPNNALGTVIVVDTGKDVRSPEAMTFITDDIHALHHNGFHFRDEAGEWLWDKTGTKGRLFKDPYPLSEQLFLATWKPKGPAWDAPLDYQLCLLDDQGRTTPLFTDETISCWHPFPLRRRTKPPVNVSNLDPKLAEKGEALCVVADVYSGMEGVAPGTVKYLRVMEEVPRPWAVRKSWYQDDRDGMAHTAVGEGQLGLKIQYGVVPVEEDGSAYFRVPAERNLFFQTLDEDLLAVQTERTYVHYMPGETRSCIGCHEKPNRTQPGKPGALAAMLRAPSVPEPQPGETAAQKLFDYDRQIQPLWDRHCVECHNHDQADGGLNLCGDAEGVYSISYNQLVKLSLSDKQLLGSRVPRIEDIASAGVEYLPPYSLGALTSPLATMLSGGKIAMRDARLREYADALRQSHPDIRLDDGDLLTVTNWLDANVPYHRSYWGRMHVKYQDHPNYRLDVTFAEAIAREIPERIAAGERQGTAVAGAE